MRSIPGRVWQILFLVALVGSLWLFLTPQPPQEPVTVQHVDKLGHALVFAALALLALRAFPQGSGRRIFLALLAYGILVEVAQTRVPNRSADALDVLADALGAAIAFARRRAPPR